MGKNLPGALPSPCQPLCKEGRSHMIIPLYVDGNMSAEPMFALHAKLVGLTDIATHQCLC